MFLELMTDDYVTVEDLDQAVTDLMDEIAAEQQLPQANGINYNIAALHNIGAPQS